MITSKTHQGENNLPYGYYRCSKWKGIRKIDCADIDKEFTNQLQNLIKEYYSRTLSEATKRGIREAKKRKNENNNIGNTDNSH